MNPNMNVEKPELVEVIARNLGSVVGFYFKAQGAHFNVAGPDFAEYHAFFGMLYEDAIAQVDIQGEFLRFLGAQAPCCLKEYVDLNLLPDSDTGNDPMLMIQDLYEANNMMIEFVNTGFKAATDADEQGIANYFAERDGVHKKWKWQLQMFMKNTRSNYRMGKSDAAQPISAEDVIPDETPVVEQLMGDENGCPLCGPGIGCACPGCEGSPCLCEETCSCPECHVIMAAGSRPAPKKDQIKGSDKNSEGSAAGGKKIVFSDKVESALRNKVEEHNKNAKAGRKATLPMLKAVYRRGSGAFSSSHRPGKTRDQWAMARVNAFLKLLKSGSPANPNYKQDNDLLPKGHPKSSRAEASLLNHELLQVALKPAEEYGSPEHAIFSMAEYSGLGYDAIPALRGAWLRGVRDGDIPFQRAYELATKLYDSRDADLLPKKNRKVTGE